MHIIFSKCNIQYLVFRFKIIHILIIKFTFIFKLFLNDKVNVTPKLHLQGSFITSMVLESRHIFNSDTEIIHLYSLISKFF
jgi:hypothetical protein